jgi:hypothetical protein
VVRLFYLESCLAIVTCIDLLKPSSTFFNGKRCLGNTLYNAQVSGKMMDGRVEIKIIQLCANAKSLKAKVQVALFTLTSTKH